ncbi:MAG: Mur ligase family protein [Candidatus Gracilibacteria bacterium]
MSSLLRPLFCLLARLCILRHKPFVIGITGSFGKTTARHIVTEIFKQNKSDVWTPEGNYNGEWGLPLAVLQARSGGKNPLKWLWAFGVGIFSICRPQYPRILVLEYGIDHPGEMKVQTDIVEPDIVLFTTLSPSHLEGFSDVQEYYDEKQKILSRKRKNTFAIGNKDDIHQADFPCQMWYGHKEGDIVFSDIGEAIDSTMASITYQNQQYTLETPILGQHHIGLIAGAILVAAQMRIEMPAILKALTTIDLPYGRGNVLRGISDALIIDGTYNGGFEPIIAGVQMAHRLAEANDRTLIAIIGDMRELGSSEKERHEELWNELKKIEHVSYIFVGDICHTVIRPLIPYEHIQREVFFLDSREAGKCAQGIISQSPKKSLVFAKGSQNTLYLEEALKYIILPEERRKLVRQDAMYMNKKNTFWKRLNGL